MKARRIPPSKGKSDAQQIDAIIREQGDWRGDTLSQLRSLIQSADPDLVEEVKWKKPSNPMGVPVWSHDGIVCIGEALKKAVRLTFPKGAQLKDPEKLFNTRLESRAVRALDIHEGERISAAALKELIREASALNLAGKRKLLPKAQATR